MKGIVGKKEMQEIDRYTIEEIGIPSMVLMERAALAVCEQVCLVAEKTKPIWAVCGNGNNGADGIATARMLYLLGYQVKILLLGPQHSGSREYLKQLEIAEKLKLEIVNREEILSEISQESSQNSSQKTLQKSEHSKYEQCDVLIDAVFGIGLSRAIEGEIRESMEWLCERHPRMVVAVDIPSGIHADTGEWLGAVIPANITVTFGWKKRGMEVYPGRTACGRVVTADIGFPEIAFQKVHPQVFTLEKTDLARIPERVADSNKGSFGKVLIIAGSKNMSGAAYLSALAAYRSGAGLVRIVTDESNRMILQTQLPEAILTSYQTEQINQEGVSEWVEQLCSWASVIVIGPGLSREPFASRLLGLVLENAYVPIILDADGLNAVAEYPHLTSYFTDNIIVTPHLGEMARLTGKEIAELRENLYQAAREYSDEYGVTCVLKDAACVTAFRDGSICVNESGCSAMAKGGSGDVLTGIIAGFLASGMEEKEAVSLGVYVHGLSGELAAQVYGNESVLAGEIANQVGNVLKERKKYK